MSPKDTAFYSRIGRIGGSARSQRKTEANRLKARKAAYARWHKEKKSAGN